MNPVKAVSSEQFLVGSRNATTGALTTVACAASGAYTQAGSAVTAASSTNDGMKITAGVIDVSVQRRVGIWLAVNGAASESSAKVSVLVLGSAVGTVASAPPTGIMDVWHALQVTDGSVTSAALGGAMVGSMVLTATPNWGTVAMFGANLTSPALTSANDRWRGRYTVDVTDCRWLQILYAESGDTAHPSTVAISISGAV